ncbi:MAG: IS1182 family transposase [Rhodomicrobium sp.]
MSKTFRAWKIDQPLLLPLTVQDFVAPDHLARFVLALIVDELDLIEIVAAYSNEKGQPPFNPHMMTALLLYAYCRGIYSSRRIARACRERVDFMSIVALDPPDFRTISTFRKRHLKALAKLFVQVLKLCEKAGLVKLGHVALDGTKIKANASKHKAMSYERMEKRAAELEAEVAKWLSSAEAADAEEDKLYGRDKSGEEMPDWVADKKRRAETIRAAKAALEAEAKAAAEAKVEEKAAAEEKRQAEGRKKPGPKAAPPSGEPAPKAQMNFTDPESRIMKSKDGFVQAFNAQAAVDAEAQIIVAQGVTQDANDKRQLVPMTDAIETNLGRRPEQLSADSGYCSDANIEVLEARGIDGYIAPGRTKDAANGAAEVSMAAPPAEASATASPEPASAPTRVEAMREKIKAGGHDSPYRLRKQLPEPVFGQIKQARGFRQFLLRGLENVQAEWSMVCAAHNLLKLAQRRTLSAMQSMAVQARPSVA